MSAPWRRGVLAFGALAACDGAASTSTSVQVADGHSALDSLAAVADAAALPGASDAPPTVVDATAQPQTGLTTIPGAPAWATPAKAAVLHAPAPVTTLGIAGKALWAGTAQGVFELTAEGGAAVTAVNLAAMPTATGAVRAMAQGPGGLWVAADHGFFVGNATGLSAVAVDPTVAASSVVSMAPTADGKGLWLATTQGVYRLAPNAVHKLNGSAGLDLANPVGIAESGGQVWVASGAALVQLPVAGGAVKAVATGPLFASGAAAVQGVAGFATQSGALVVAEGSAARLLTLGDAQPLPCRAVAASIGADGKPRLWFATDQGAIAALVQPQDPARAPTLQAIALPAATGAATVTAIALDAWGHVWLARGADVHGMLVGNPPSFSKAVAPILVSRCAPCHASGALAPKHDFGHQATVQALHETMLLRMSFGQVAAGAPGQMPPKTAVPLSAAEYQTVVDWFASGMYP